MCSQILQIYLKRNKRSALRLMQKIETKTNGKSFYNRQTERQADRQTDRRRQRQRDRETERQTDGQTDRHTETKTDRQTDRRFSKKKKKSFTFLASELAFALLRHSFYLVASFCFLFFCFLFCNCPL